MVKPKIRVVGPEEAETMDYVICHRAEDDPGYFKDNVRGTCIACGSAVVFRPYMPKRPPRLCLECAVAIVKPH